MTNNDSRHEDSTEEVEIYIEAFADSGLADEPEYVKIGFNSVLADRINLLASLCVMQGLSQVREWRYPEWGPSAVTDGLSIQDTELCVTSDSFCFTAYPKHLDCRVRTTPIDIAQTIAAVAAGDRFFGDSIDSLKRRVEAENAARAETVGESNR